MKKFEKPILVTRPYLPDLVEYKRGIEEIWANQWLTNNGPLLQRFHRELATYLKVSENQLALFNNGTMALELGYAVMGLSGGEVITTPFTFAATAHALVRIGATPIFGDIDPRTLCLDPNSAEKLITPKTKAIVPVHVYGAACDLAGFNRLSEKYGVKIIYDAAHAFGTGLHLHGDMSMFSFHPTKLFHSCEGGCLIFKDERIQKTLFEQRNFSIVNELECNGVGTNAKMNEFQALMGLSCLKNIDGLLSERKRIYDDYVTAFSAGCAHDLIVYSSSLNKAYVPILLKDFSTRERVYEKLKEANVYARRYFYPLLSDFRPYLNARGECPIAKTMATRVLTLPTYFGLSTEDIQDIVQNVLEIVG